MLSACYKLDLMLDLMLDIRDEKVNETEAVQNLKVLILPYLQPHRSACHSFMDNARVYDVSVLCPR